MWLYYFLRLLSLCDISIFHNLHRSWSWCFSLRNNIILFFSMPLPFSTCVTLRLLFCSPCMCALFLACSRVFYFGRKLCISLHIIRFELSSEKMLSNAYHTRRNFQSRYREWNCRMTSSCAMKKTSRKFPCL